MRKYVKINTPFYKSQKYNGFPSKDCLSINNELFESLAVDNNNEILFDIRMYDINEKRLITIGDLKKLLLTRNAKRNSLSVGRMININRLYCKLVK